MMRPTVFILTVAISAIACGSVNAMEITSDTLLGHSQTHGIASDGDTQSYRFKSLVDQNVLFSVDSAAGFCGADITQSNRSGQLKITDHFPDTFSDRAQAGDVFTISFYQNRAAFTSKQDCVYSFSVTASQL